MSFACVAIPLINVDAPGLSTPACSICFGVIANEPTATVADSEDDVLVVVVTPLAVVVVVDEEDVTEVVTPDAETTAAPWVVAAAAGPCAAVVATLAIAAFVGPGPIAFETDGVVAGTDAAVAIAGGEALVAAAVVVCSTAAEGAAGSESLALRVVLTSTP
jgi:hypothetical protein